MYSHKVLRGSNLQTYTLPSLEDRDEECRDGGVTDDIDVQPEHVVDPEAIEREARQRAQQIEKDAYEKGFQAGLVEGQKSFEENVVLLIGQLETMLTQFEQLREKQLQEIEPQLLTLAITIAKKALYEELSINPDFVVKLVKEGINRLEKMGQITIKIHPSLHDLFLKKRPEFLELHQEVVLDIDPSLPVNGPVVVGPMEEVVTNVDELLINILEDMRQKLVAS
ncbi:MAG: FliH/SctL family protein [Nitrospirota bacterium]